MEMGTCCIHCTFHMVEFFSFFEESTIIGNLCCDANRNHEDIPSNGHHICSIYCSFWIKSLHVVRTSGKMDKLIWSP